MILHTRPKTYPYILKKHIWPVPTLNLWRHCPPPSEVACLASRMSQGTTLQIDSNHWQTETKELGKITPAWYFAATKCHNWRYPNGLFLWRFQSRNSKCPFKHTNAKNAYASVRLCLFLRWRTSCMFSNSSNTIVIVMPEVITLTNHYFQGRQRESKHSKNFIFNRRLVWHSIWNWIQTEIDEDFPGSNMLNA